MTPAEERQYWMARAKTYAHNAVAMNQDNFIQQWQVDALYVAYLRGVQDALKIRIVD